MPPIKIWKATYIIYNEYKYEFVHICGFPHFIHIYEGDRDCHYLRFILEYMLLAQT